MVADILANALLKILLQTLTFADIAAPHIEFRHGMAVVIAAVVSFLGLWIAIERV